MLNLLLGALARRRCAPLLARIELVPVLDWRGLLQALSALEAQPPPGLALVLVADLAALLAGLFVARPPAVAHALVARLSLRLRRLARGLASRPLVLLLNRTTRQRGSGDDARLALPGPHGGAESPLVPAFGSVFAQLLDLNLLCQPLALADKTGSIIAVEVLADHLGLWQGVGAKRRRRDHRWAPVRLLAGRLVDEPPSEPATA